jgi:glutamate synthase (ferredoxin)
VLNQNGDFGMRCNQEMVGLYQVTDETELDDLYALIQKHAVYTGSQHAWKILTNWEVTSSQFLKVLPYDYKRMLDAIADMEAQGLSGEEAVMAAFEANKNDKARVAGN